MVGVSPDSMLIYLIKNLTMQNLISVVLLDILSGKNKYMIIFHASITKLIDKLKDKFLEYKPNIFFINLCHSGDCFIINLLVDGW